jgi:DNA-binding IclR family transcriptional regulator
LATPKIAEALDYPTSTTKRALEDLTAHKIARRTSRGEGSADTWQLTEQAHEWYSASNSEMSVGV